MTLSTEIETIAHRLLARRPEPDDGALLLRIAARVRFVMRELEEEPVVVAFPDQGLRVVQ